MKINQNIMKSEERATFQLRSLYQQLRLPSVQDGKFEEYELTSETKILSPLTASSPSTTQAAS
ncbi:MAG: hypothetical protein ACLVC5_09155 [Clostridia bacterium]